MPREGSATPRSLAGGGLELLGIELLEDQARRLAALLSLARRQRGKGGAHLRRLNKDARQLRAVYLALAEDARRDSVSPAAEWLLDNFHIISAAVRDIHHDLPASFFRRLPVVATDEFAGLPRVYALALELIRCSAGSLDAQRLHRCVTAFQSVTPLTIGELWAWPSALKLGLVEHLRVRADILANTRAHQRQADALAGALDNGAAPTGKFPSEIHPAFVIRLLQRSREYGATAAAMRRQLEEALAERGQTVEDAIRSEGHHQAAEQATMANLIGSLRLISSFDWSEFFERVSLVEQVLRRDPAGFYGGMDFHSRDRYRQAIEQLADPTGDDQLRVALKSVERARMIGARTPDARGTHVGDHLIGNGRRAFEDSVGMAAGAERTDSAAVLSPRDGGVPGNHCPRHERVRGRRGRMGARAGMERRSARLRGAAQCRSRQRIRHPADAAVHQLLDSAKTAAEARARRRARVGADDGHRADDPRSR